MSELDALSEANRVFARRYPGDPAARQPVHTVYGGAQLFAPETTAKLGAIALRTLHDHAPDAAALASAIGRS